MVSIIIVNYHVKRELFDCIASIFSGKTKTLFEVVVVDNDEKPTIEKELKKNFPRVKYISGHGNVGFGAGNNIGAEKAKGKYLFFLNPDTKVLSGAIDNLVSFFNQNKQAAIVAPLLHHMNKKPYQQGSLDLTPSRAIMSISFLHKLFPNNPVAKKYYLDEWNKKTIKEVDVIPGTAFMIKKDFFERIAGFDENFFLFFEEFDLCRRVKKLKGKIYILPTAKILHHWGASTKKSRNINKTFIKSRFYYFKKQFGILKAVLTESILRINLTFVLLAVFITLGGFLRLIRIEDAMIFIGDQGWFYISARDMLVNGTIPLVGIASSHPWLHQGPLWTYMLAIFLWLFNFNPISGAYLSTMLDLFAIYFVYKLGNTFFSKTTGLTAAVLYATSPIVISNARMPYHTSPIPLFTILAFYCMYKWINGQKYYFPLLVMLLAVLYNLQIASFLLSVIVGVIIFYGLIKNTLWGKAILNIRVIVLSLLCFVIPMLPMFIYDFGHGFPQTLKFLAWVGYKLLVFFGYPPINPVVSATSSEMLIYFSNFLNLFIFPYNHVLSLTIAFFTVLILFIVILKKKADFNTRLLFITAFLLIAGVYFAKTTSGAYLPILFPSFILIFAILFDKLFSHKIFIYFASAMLFLLVIGNSNYIMVQRYEDSILNRIEIAKHIIKEAKGKNYNLVVETPERQSFEFAKNYAYLTWYYGHEPSFKKESLLFVVEEKFQEIKVRKEINHD